MEELGIQALQYVEKTTVNHSVSMAPFLNWSHTLSDLLCNLMVKYAAT